MTGRASPRFSRPIRSPAAPVVTAGGQDRLELGSPNAAAAYAGHRAVGMVGGQAMKAARQR